MSPIAAIGRSPADEALKIGLVNRVVDEGEALPEALARRLPA